jgi:hypothetical protein
LLQILRLIIGDNGWECLQRSLEVRNRITHPKVRPDLEIADEEMEQFGNGSIWFDKAVSSAIDVTEKGYVHFLNRLKNSVKLNPDEFMR